MDQKKPSTLVLNRITHPYQALRCHATNKTLSYGDYFYYDTETGHVIDEEFYNRMKLKRRRDNAMGNVNKAQSEVQYRNQLLVKTADYLQRNILEFDRLQDHQHEEPNSYYNIVFPMDEPYEINNGGIADEQKENFWGDPEPNEPPLW